MHATDTKNVDEVIDDILIHYGKLGMKWGRRQAARSAQKREVSVKDKDKKIKTSGGKGVPAHPDAIAARKIGQISKESGLKAVSNKDLQTFNQRLNLEQQAKRLKYQDQSAARRFIQTVTLRNVGKGVEAGSKAAGGAALGYTLGSGSVKKRMATGAAALALMG